MTADWSPQQYLRFADERTRAARDLLAQVPLSNPQLVYDLGCGPGNSTALLDRAYPDALIIGVDNSKAMLDRARADLPNRRFEEADLEDWLPEAGADLIFSNATFQWLKAHAAILQRLVSRMKVGAVLAMQMPDNLGEPSHQLMREVAAIGPWAERLRGAGTAREAMLTPTEYYNLLRPHCSRVDIWHTVYNHPLDGAQGIVDFVSSTGLRPFLDPLAPAERGAFLAAYTARIAQAYPSCIDGKVLLRFPRIFMLAVV